MTATALRSVPRSTKKELEAKTPITAGEFQLYFNSVDCSLDGLAGLVKLSLPEGDPWSSEAAAWYALDAAQTKLCSITAKLSARFNELHGDSPHSLPKEKQIAISKEEIDELEAALAPACSFISLVCKHDIYSDNPVACNVGWAGQFLESVGREWIQLLRSRLEA